MDCISRMAGTGNLAHYTFEIKESAELINKLPNFNTTRYTFHENKSLFTVLE